MKKILIIDCEKQPDLITNHYYTAAMTEPLGLMYIESYLQNHGVDVKFIRQPYDNKKFDSINQADIVGISGLTHTWPTMLDVARRVRELNPKAIIVAGREHAACAPEMVLNCPEFDLVIAGEGESGLLALAKGKPFSKVPGAIYRDREGNISYIKRQRLCEKDVYPLKRRKELMVNMFQETASIFSHQAGVIMGRGCIFKCVFCTAPKMWEGYRSLGIDNAINEIVRTHDQYGIKYFAMHDLMLNVNKHTIETFCQELIKRDLNIALFGFMSATKAKVDLKLMKQAGFHEFGTGIEIPGPERIALGKRFSFDTVRRFFDQASLSGIFTKGYTIIGWPWDQNEDEVVDRYLRALRTVPVNNLRITFLTPFPGTDTFDKYRDKIAFSLTDESYVKFTTMEPILDFGLSVEQLFRIRDRILCGYYSSQEYIKLIKSQSRLGIVDNMNSAMYEWAYENNLLSRAA